MQSQKGDKVLAEDSTKHTVVVTGGGGYVGSKLVPELLASGYRVRAVDLFIYGNDALRSVAGNPELELVTADIRDANAMEKAMAGANTVIHLACISNDPSFELNPDLGKSINFDAFAPMVKIAEDAGVTRFINASSSSVYGVKPEGDVDEDASLEPLTDYSKFKAMCEEELAKFQSDHFTTVTLRPATVCGYAPRQRLDVIVNILTNHAVVNRKIRVFGGTQLRPNIHIDDMVDAYLEMLRADKELIAGKAFNVGANNFSVMELAERIRDAVGFSGVELQVEPTDDPRSYHVSSKRIARELGFVPGRTIEQAAVELRDAIGSGVLTNTMSNSRYFNVQRMKEIALV